MTSLAGDVYQPHRDPFTGRIISLRDGRMDPDIQASLFLASSKIPVQPPTQVLPTHIPVAPSIGEVPDQGMFDVNAGELPVSFDTELTDCVCEI